jgi:hypothetical protein
LRIVLGADPPNFSCGLEVKMRQSFPITFLAEAERSRWTKFRKSLTKEEDKEAFDRLLGRTSFTNHSDFSMNPPANLETALRMLLEHEKMISNFERIFRENLFGMKREPENGKAALVKGV